MRTKSSGTCSTIPCVIVVRHLLFARFVEHYGKAEEPQPEDLLNNARLLRGYGMRFLAAVLIVVAAGMLSCSQEALPTYTPYPTLEPLPTYTPFPTPEPVVHVVREAVNWTSQPNYAGRRTYTTINVEENEAGRGPWWLMLSCAEDETLGVFMGSIFGGIFYDTEEFDAPVLAEVDDLVLEQTWTYFPASEFEGDYFGYYSYWPGVFIKQLMNATVVKFTIPATISDYEFSFEVAGLSRQLKDPISLCADDRS